MKRPHSKLLFAIACTLSLASSQNGYAGRGLKRHWRETASETLWTDRYNNCDYAYYVLLPAGVVGHGTLPPSPNHGFLIALPDVGKTDYALDRKERFIWVDASYNTGDARSLNDLVRERESGDIKYSSRLATRVAGLSALQVRAEQGSGVLKTVAVETLALRAGIIYTIGLQTKGAAATEDEVEYRRIILGFKLLPLPQGQCSNG